MKKLIYLTLISIITLFSCEESGDTTNYKTDNLTTITWETSNGFTECDENNSLKFSDTGEVETFILKSELCDYKITYGTYTIENNILQIHLINHSFEDSIYTTMYNILTLNNTTLTLQEFYNDEVGYLEGDLISITYTK